MNHRIKYCFVSFVLSVYISNYISAQPSTDRNFVSSSVIKQPGITSQAGIDALTAQGRNTQVAYLDGLGRPLQSVALWSSLSGKDLITPVEYDNYGREVKKFLPYMDGSAAASGSFRTTAYADQKSFYTIANSTDVAKDDYPFAQSFLEFSPLNRPLETGAQGASWQPGGNATGNHTIKSIVSLNTITDDVKRWKVTDVSNAFGTYSLVGTAYAANELYKNTTTDADNKQVVEYKDREGKVILKKIQLSNSPGVNHTGWLCTYYIYDDFNRLRAVLQPKAVEKLDPSNPNSLSWIPNTDILDELTFRYEYDEKGRMIMKKVPGAGAVYMVYDIRDRLVMTQDAVLRNSGQWLVTLYDYLNRPIQTGKWSDATSFINHKIAANTASNFPNTASTYPTTTALVAPAYDPLTETHYDDYNNIPSASGLNGNFDNSASPYFITPYNSAPRYALEPIKANALGQVTWTAVKVLGSPTGQFLYTVNIYDVDGRVIQVKSKNYATGTDLNTTQYNFSGQPVQTIVHHQNGSNSYILRTHFYYDDLGRVTDIYKNLNEVGWTRISATTYDAIGQPKTKKLSPDFNSNAGLETLTYDYNIRGWLLGVNKSDLSGNGAGTQKFGFELGYDKQTNTAGKNYTTAQYNGNITGMIWKSAGDGIRRKYDYSYDNANRLMQGLFEQHNDGGSWANDQLNFDVKMGDGINSSSAYDANGNIKQMQQWGIKGLSIAPIDNLTYGYNFNNGSNELTNKLYRVTDAHNDAATKLGDFKDGGNSGDDYSYDLNGNLTLDNNKAISSISYNHLNLPQLITVTGKGTIEYTYDAGGNKLKKVTLDQSISGKTITTTTSYFGGFVYESKQYSNPDPGQVSYADQLQFISHEEGRIRFEKANTTCTTPLPDRYIYDYFIKDHLGNIRMVLTEQQDPVCYIAASVEDSRYQAEDDIYDIQNGRRIERSVTNAPQTSFEDKLYQTHGGIAGQKTGLGAVIKVMSGDKVTVFAESYYSLISGNANQHLNMTLTDLLTTLAGSGAVNALKGSVTGSQIENLPGNTSNLQNFLNRTPVTDQAKAYLNWVLFDEQLKYVSSGADPVLSGGGYKPHIAFVNAPVNVTKNGFLYVFVSNESNLPVYFDNLAITHSPGAIVEETHYYPFGLTMAGISSKSFGVIENKKKFNDGTELESKDFSDGSGLELYATEFRSYDPQIGRFHQIDELSDYFQRWSPYTFALNNPLLFNDPFGLSSEVVESPGPETSTEANPTKLEEVIVVGFKSQTNSHSTTNVQTNTLIPQSMGPRPNVVDVGSGVKPSNNSNKGTMGGYLLAGATVVSRGTVPGLIVGGAMLFWIMWDAQPGDLSPTYRPGIDNVYYTPPTRVFNRKAELERSERSLEKNVKEHEQKIQDYKNDPDKYDNLGLLKNQTPDRREKIIQGRIRALEKQVEKNQNELNKVREQLAALKQN